MSTSVPVSTTTNEVCGAAPTSTASSVPTSTSHVSTAASVATAARVSTTLVAVSKGGSHREAADTHSHSDSHPIPNSAIRAKPLDRQQNLHKEPFKCSAESYTRSSPAFRKDKK